MEEYLGKIQSIKTAIEKFNPQTTQELEAFRIQYLGANSVIKQLMGSMKEIEPDQRKEFGLNMNNLKLLAENAFQNFKSTIQVENTAKVEMDYSLPGTTFPQGSRHPLSLIRARIVQIFSNLGFGVAEGPEIEDDWHNFGALNLAEDHPARDMQDTFYVSQNPAWMLRTHTSNVQIREMEKGKLPIRLIMPGRVYRNETISARAHCFFHQVEGLYIAEHVSFADLKQTLYHFVREMFGQDIKIRFRPSYFPFTEPSAEMDITCLICNGSGCNVCKQSGWVEILGCGMVHPNVLRNCKIDPNKYSGFAFGMGIERITMLKYQIKDLRLFSENDVRFLAQFSGEFV